MNDAIPELVAAIDIGGSKTLVTVRPRHEDAWRQGKLRGDVHRAPTVRDPVIVADTIAAVIRQAGQAIGGRIVAVGLAAPGPVDRASGVIVHSPNLGWHDVPLGPLLAERLDAQVLLDDDANLGAGGESTHGAGIGADSLAYLTVSTGLGLGIIQGGRPWRGAHGLAGEIGHLVLHPDGPRCSCGRHGCLEAYVGGNSLARRTRRLPNAPGGPAADGTSWLFEASRRGDEGARRLVEEAAVALAHAIAAVASLLDPERIVVGGGIALAQPDLLRRARNLAGRRMLAEVGRRTVVVPAALGDESVLAGAATLARRWMDDPHGESGPDSNGKGRVPSGEHAATRMPDRPG